MRLASLRGELDDPVHVHELPPSSEEEQRLARPAGGDPTTRLHTGTGTGLGGSGELWLPISRGVSM
eukprot:6187603-Pleurochrysis_carterae.AAC.4